MTNLLEISYEHIEALNDLQLTDILRRLLHLEAVGAGIPVSNVDVSLNINVADGGEDGRIKWEAGPANTAWIPNRFTLFQCKATDMPPAGCKSELLIKSTTNLKPRVEEVLDAGGSYILFYNRSCNSTQQIARVSKFREALKEAGKDYSDTADIIIYDANKIAEWVNKYLSVIAAVFKYNRRPLPEDMETWSSWSRYKDNQYTYVCDPIIIDQIKALRQHLSGIQKVARIVGLSGLGKTRLAFETLRPPSDPTDYVQQALSDHTVYLDAATNSNNLLSIIGGWRSEGLKGLIVVDNCPMELHQQLIKKIQHSDSQLNLLTMDYNPEKMDADYPFIEIKKASTETVIKPMLKIAYPELKDEDINRIAIFAEGFPQMAVLLAEARLNDKPDIGNLENPVLLEKLLWGRSQPDQEAHVVISACALFEQMGFSDDLVEQRRFVSEKFCGMDPDRFFELATSFIERGILDKRGRYVSVTPIPLAIRLSASWWKRCAPERALRLITEPMPSGMSTALCDQISKLHFVTEARELTKQLCGIQGPFGQAEVLNSEEGSRLFRSLSEVNPQAAVEAIERVFGSCTTEQLKHVVQGRRNLVWTLEKLCFWGDTFNRASKLLLAFAVAENETWSNNATGLFLQLFSVFLSGTQASPMSRIVIIDEALESPEFEYKELGLKALGSILETRGFSRTMGVETQGSRAPQKEWRPREWSEVFNYWSEALTRLAHFIARTDELGELARDITAEHMPGLVRNGRIEELERLIQTVVDQGSILWTSALEAIQDLIKYDDDQMPKEINSRLIHWIDMLQPRQLSERLHLIVSNPPFDHQKGEDGHYIDHAAMRAKDLAKEIIDNSQKDWVKFLPIVLQGEQKQGYVFGISLGENIKDPFEFIEASLAILNDLRNEGNSIVVGGFLFALRQKNVDIVTETLQTIASNENLRVHLIGITRLSKPEPSDLERVLQLLADEVIPLEDIRAFAYGSVLDHLDEHVIIEFCDTLREHSAVGAWIALDIITLYTLHDPKRQEICKDALFRILITSGLLAAGDKFSTGDIWRWKETVIDFLKIEGAGSRLAAHLVEEIITLSFDVVSKYALLNQMREVIKELLNRYKDIIWPKLSDHLLSDDNRVSLRMKYLLKNETFSWGDEENTCILLELPQDLLEEWCLRNPEKAPQILATLVSIYEKNDASWTFNSLTKWLLDNFGQQKAVLSAIYSNMSSFGWSGSMVPYLQKQIEVIQQVRNHKFLEVRAWSNHILTYLEEKIKRERVLDKEKEHGIYDE